MLRRFFSFNVLNPLLGIRSCSVRPSAPFCTSQENDTETMVQEIAKGDKQIEKRLRVLMLEVDMTRQDGRKAPDEGYMKKKHWEALLALNSYSARSKYLTYLFKNCMASQNKKIKKKESWDKYLAMKEATKEDDKVPDENAIIYNLSNNSMFLRIYEKSINQFYNHKLLQAMMFGPKLIFDCSYDKYMVPREAVNAANQLTHFFASNRVHKMPFDLHLCNCKMDSTVIKQLYTNIPTLSAPEFPLTLHQESYLDLFPKEKLVYLTPHCRTELVYDPEDIYIIGCMVDKISTQPYSLAKAKENKLRMAKLPLDKYLHWCSGSGKSLTINQVGDIILDMNETRDWNKAFKHVPRRKIDPEGPVESSPQTNKFFFSNMKPKYNRKFDSEYNVQSITSKNKFNKRTRPGLKIDSPY